VNTELREKLVELMRDAGRAHHAAFEATDGADPDWPLWYADYLQAPLFETLQVPFTKSRLVYCLMDADSERTARAPDSSWPELYANHVLGCFARSTAPAEDRLDLYYSRS